jgi:hypothetical protein
MAPLEMNEGTITVKGAQRACLSGLGVSGLVPYPGSNLGRKPTPKRKGEREDWLNAGRNIKPCSTGNEPETSRKTRNFLSSRITSAFEELEVSIIRAEVLKELHVYGQLNYFLQDQRAQMAEKTNFLMQKNRGMTTRVYYKSQTEAGNKSIIPWESGGLTILCSAHTFHVCIRYWSQNRQYNFPTHH